MANGEHLALLRQGSAIRNDWQRQNPDNKPDLEEANLSGANLSGADLQGAALQGADLLGQTSSKQISAGQTWSGRASQERTVGDAP